MLTRKKFFDFKHDYEPVTASAIVIAARAAGAEKLTDAILSNWGRERSELDADTLSRIEVGMAALANLCHAGYEWPLDFSSPKMDRLIKKYVAEHQAYLLEKSCDGNGDGR